MDSYYSVVVVGAGLSGLYAAQLLKTHLPAVLVLEAQDVIGGRVQQASANASCHRNTDRVDLPEWTIEHTQQHSAVLSAGSDSPCYYSIQSLSLQATAHGS